MLRKEGKMSYDQRLYSPGPGVEDYFLALYGPEPQKYRKICRPIGLDIMINAI